MIRLPRAIRVKSHGVFLFEARSQGLVRYHDGSVRWPAISLFLLGIAWAFGQQTSPTALEGRIITRVDFLPETQPITAAERDQLLLLRAGSPLRKQDVRATIQALYNTGRYRDLAVDAQADNEGVRIQIQAELTYFVSGINVEGEADPPNASQLATAAKLTLGGPVVDTDVEVAERNILERLRANGLYRARSSHSVARVPATEEASVFFRLQPGDRAHFDGAKFTGEFKRTQDELIAKTGWHRGILFLPLPGWRELTENRLQAGIQKILEDLQKQDRLQSRVTLTGLEYHEDTNRVTPTLEIDMGPITQVRASGARLSRGKLRQLIPVYQERAVDRNLLVEGRRNLEEYFESRGYFDAMVDFTQAEPKPGESLIEYKIDQGPRHKLVNIELVGNKYFDNATLRERMFMVPATFLRNRNGRYSQRLLENDRDTIRDLYRANGFRDVEVTSSVIDGYRGKDSDLAVTIQVKEGAQWLVNSLIIAGATPEDEEYLTSVVQSTQGQPFSEANVASDRDTILSYYYNNGYPDAAFEWSQTEMPDTPRVDLRFTVTPGPRQFVRGILINGLKVTDPGLVNERMLLEPGAPISQSKIGQSQQKLYDLGIFAKVQTALQNPEGSETSKYVIFHMDEARKYSFNFGLGAELGRIGGGVVTLDAPAGTAGFSPRASFGVSRINLMGLGHTISVQTLASTIRQRALSTYLAPQFKGKENLSLALSALTDNSRDVRTFSSFRVEGSVQLSQRLSRANTVQYRYSFRRVDLSNLNIDPSLVGLYSQPDLTGLVGVSFIQDRRDDPINSHRGIYNTVDLSLAAKPFGAQTDFSRLLMRNSTYHRIGRDVVLARTVQFGYIQRLGGMPHVPPPELFYAGGASSHRAFPDNQAGPRDLTTGFPVGGSALLMHSTELRFPLIGDNLGGVLFHDMGNVFTDITKLSFRVVQRSVQDFDYMVHGVGFGIRYRTPVGPVRVDLSLSPNSPRFVGYAGTREELIANLPDPVRQRINVFQFHFSLGQTF
jgi:outer membrane protein insertion porin family